MTKEAFENAIAVTMALGGSTNAVLHLLAIANEARVDLEPGRLQRGRRPGAPSGRHQAPRPYHMADLDRIGGVPVVMAELLDAGLLHGDCLTVTGRTVAENLAALHPPPPDGEVVHALDRPHPRPGGHRRSDRHARAQGRGGQGGRHRPADASTGPPGCSTARTGDGGHPGRFDPARHRGGHPLRGSQGRPGDARDAGGDRRDEGRGTGRRTAPWSPTDGSPAGPTGSASATWPPRRSTGVPSPWWPTATGSAWTWSPTPSTWWSDEAELDRRRAELKHPGPALHDRGAGQVRPAGHRGGTGRDHRALSPARIGDYRPWPRGATSSRADPDLGPAGRGRGSSGWAWCMVGTLTKERLAPDQPGRAPDRRRAALPGDDAAVEEGPRPGAGSPVRRAQHRAGQGGHRGGRQDLRAGRSAIDAPDEKERYCRALEDADRLAAGGRFSPVRRGRSPRWATSWWPTGVTRPGPGGRPADPCRPSRNSPFGSGPAPVLVGTARSVSQWRDHVHRPRAAH